MGCYFLQVASLCLGHVQHGWHQRGHPYRRKSLCLLVTVVCSPAKRSLPSPSTRASTWPPSLRSSPRLDSGRSSRWRPLDSLLKYPVIRHCFLLELLLGPLSLYVHGFVPQIVCCTCGNAEYCLVCLEPVGLLGIDVRIELFDVDKIAAAFCFYQVLYIEWHHLPKQT
jgi:hypothetical protein